MWQLLPEAHRVVVGGLGGTCTVQVVVVSHTKSRGVVEPSIGGCQLHCYPICLSGQSGGVSCNCYGWWVISYCGELCFERGHVSVSCR